MPLYEYRCKTCGLKSTIYSRTYSSAGATCPGCGKGGLTRLFSTFQTRKGYKDTYEDILSDSQLTRGMMRDDPRALVEWNRRMSGGEKAAPEYEDMLGRMEKGEMPKTK